MSHIPRIPRTRLFACTAAFITIVAASAAWLPNEPRAVSRPAPAGAQQPIDQQGARHSVPVPGAAASVLLSSGVLDNLTLLEHIDITADGQERPVRLMAPGEGQKLVWGWRAGVEQSELTASSWSVERAVGGETTLSMEQGGHRYSIRFMGKAKYLSSIVMESSHPEATPYLRLERRNPPEDGGWLFHTGMVSVLDGRQSLLDWGDVDAAGLNADGQGWAGFSDRYWLAALAPEGAAQLHLSQAPGDARRIEWRPSATAGRQSWTVQAYLGAKEIGALDQAQEDFGIGKLDQAVDYGWLAPLTQTMLHGLVYLHHIFGDMGLALLALTLLIRVAMFPLVAKAMQGGMAIGSIATQVKAAAEQHRGDEAAAKNAIAGIYLQHGLRPLAAVMAPALQLLVLFAFFKVLYLSVEMRHASFLNVIHDLSAPDPTNLLALGGLLGQPEAIAPVLYLPLWGVVFAFTVWLQGQAAPQAATGGRLWFNRMLPVLILLMVIRSPAGFLLYWSWGGLIGTAQRLLINRLAARTAALPPKAAE